MKKLVLLAVFLSFLAFSSKILAITEDECRSKQSEDVSKGIVCWEQLLGEVGQKKVTLQSEVARFNAVISLTSAKINQSIEQIKNLEKEIVALESKIGQLDVSLDQLSQILLKRISATYKKGKIEPLTLLFSAKDFSEFVSRYKYLRVMQIHDRQLMTQMESVRTNFEDQKTTKEEKQTELETAKKKLESQKILLAQQKKDKEFLLEITKNDEKHYQELLANALAEQAATQWAIAQAIKELQAGKGDPVSAGQIIAVIGNSGHPDCSTGTHLHFTILKDGVVKNPAEYLKNTSFIWDNPDPPLSFTGSWDWPISSPRITQSFGKTYYVRVLGWYGGDIHDGIDMTSSDLVIRAPKEGKIIRGATTCDSARVAGVSTLKYVAVGHPDGLISVYLHVQ